MSKTKIILAATGGVAALILLGAAYLTWDAFSRKRVALEGDSDGMVEGLEVLVDRIRSFTQKKPYPNAANVAVLEKNRRALEAWRTAARRQAAAGDWCPDETISPAQFKERVMREARRLMEHKGAVDGRLTKADFGFGPFAPYLADSLPSKDQLPRLQRQWYDIQSLCDLLVTNDVRQIVDLRVIERKEEAPKAKVKGKAKVVAADETEVKPSVVTYAISFLMMPADLMAVVRKLSACERFVVIDDLTFAHAQDVLTERLGVSEKKEAKAAAQTERRSRRRRRQEEAGEAQAAKKAIQVFNPETDSLLLAELTVSVYDFRTKEKAVEPKDRKGASK